MLETPALSTPALPAASPIAWWMPVSDDLALGAQIDQAGMDWLAAEGFSLVINLNTPSARNYWAGEAEAATRSGMQYVHFPLDCSVLTPEKYAILQGILSAHRGRRAFLHCAMNVKSSGMAHIWRVRELGHDPVSARADLSRTPGHEPKWETFWTAMGA